MKTNEKKNTSAKKKLIPAVAMLTTSAVMLSTATYAWFTLSKTAEVTGLNLAATAGGSLEISLGQVDNGVLSSSDLTPTADNISWVSTVDIGQYYEKVGKLKPASTVDGNSLSTLRIVVYTLVVELLWLILRLKPQLMKQL